jgi:hypothetical protein
MLTEKSGQQIKAFHFLPLFAVGFLQSPRRQTGWLSSIPWARGIKNSAAAISWLLAASAFS